MGQLVSWALAILDYQSLPKAAFFVGCGLLSTGALILDADGVAGDSDSSTPFFFLLKS